MARSKNRAATNDYFNGQLIHQLFSLLIDLWHCLKNGEKCRLVNFSDAFCGTKMRYPVNVTEEDKHHKIITSFD